MMCASCCACTTLQLQMKAGPETCHSKTPSLSRCRSPCISLCIHIKMYQNQHARIPASVTSSFLVVFVTSIWRERSTLRCLVRPPYQIGIRLCVPLGDTTARSTAGTCSARIRYRSPTCNPTNEQDRSTPWPTFYLFFHLGMYDTNDDIDRLTSFISFGFCN